MSVIPRLATSLNIRGEVPNILLAEEIVKTHNYAATVELSSLFSGKSKALKSDAIKVLYEVGYRNPKLIADYYHLFISLLQSKDNRLQWGAMTALDTLVPLKPDELFREIDKIIEAANKGSVITRDHAVNILLSLCTNKKYAAKSYALFFSILKDSPTNQLPAYAEKALGIMDAAHAHLFKDILSKRLSDVNTPTKKRRLEKVIQKLTLNFTKN